MASTKELNPQDLKFHRDDFKQRSDIASFSALRTTQNGFNVSTRNDNSIAGGFGSASIESKQNIKSSDIPFSKLWGQTSIENIDPNETADTKKTLEIIDANDPIAFWNSWSKQTCKQHFYQQRDGSVIKVPKCECFEGIGSIL